MLVNLIYDDIGINENSVVLDAGCGYGLSCINKSEQYKCKIIGIDCVLGHIELANKYKPSNVEFIYGSVAKLDKINKMFTHIISIEGGAHFNTRLQFYKNAYNKLEHNGIIKTTEVIMDKNTNLLVYTIGYIASLLWHVPRANFGTIKNFGDELKQIGYTDIKIDDITNNVYKGYYLSNYKNKKTLKQIYGYLYYAKLVMDFILFWLSKKKVLRYIVIFARK